jgi:hypothetical protein
MKTYSCVDQWVIGCLSPIMAIYNSTWCLQNPKDFGKASMQRHGRQEPDDKRITSKLLLAIKNELVHTAIGLQESLDFAREG